MGLGQLPPQSAAPVVMNVAGGLRVEVFLGLEFHRYFAVSAWLRSAPRIMVKRQKHITVLHGSYL
jgi:hypothetical protein